MLKIRSLLSILSACLLAFAAGGLRADTCVVDGITWTYTVSDGEAKIGNGWSSAIPTSTTGALVIPSELGGVPVTSIGSYAFEGCSGLTSVTIPSGVTSIGTYAFSDCSGLMLIEIPSSVTSIGNSAFDETPFYANQPDGMVILGGGVLYRMKGICPASVEIPSSVTRIGSSAFTGCSGLTSVEIPPSVTRIGSSAFKGCSGLTSVTIPSVYRLSSVFPDAYQQISSVTIPSSATSIGDNAFRGCSGLTFVTIPSGVTSIGSSAFSGCSGLTSVEIPSSVTSIGSSAFSGCSGLTSVEIPPSVTRIGSSAFKGCSGLTSVTIPSVYRLSSVFPDAYQQISSVVIPSGMTSIRTSAFRDCSGLTSVTIPSSVTSIGDSAFSGCSGLTSVYVSPGNAGWVRDMLTESGFDVSRVMVGTIDSLGGGDSESVPDFYPGDGDDQGGDVSAPYKVAAVVYDGYFRRGDAVAGSIQVRVAKLVRGAAKVVATVQLGPQKLSFRGGVADGEGKVSSMSVNGHTLNLKFGQNGLSGRLDGVYEIDGARCLFSSKDRTEKKIADAIVKRIKGSTSIFLPNGHGALTVVISVKGKVKIAGTVRGAKVYATAQLIVGADACAIPVVIAKKVALAFVIWVDEKGGMSVEGVKGVHIGKIGTLKVGAVLRLDASDLAKALPGLYADYLPDGLSVSQSGAKWLVAGGAKAGKVAIDRKTGEIDEAKLGANPSGMKLSCSARTGAFKGSFKAYALEKGRIKAYTANIEGVMVGNTGYGTATLKKPAVSFPVTIE